MTRICSLVFAYDMDRMESSGRHWARGAYRSKDYIFSYSAASTATFLHHNQSLEHEIHTDDPGLLLEKIREYDVPLGGLRLVDRREDIARWISESSYAFWPIVSLADELYDGERDLLKLDNDLTCLKPIDDLIARVEAGEVAMWKRERLCSQGREYWGERLACRTALGTEDFSIWNMGVTGIPRGMHAAAKNVKNLCRRVADVDISSVSYFPDAPGKKSRMWSCSEQSAVSYLLHQQKARVFETIEWFEHHCLTPSKQSVLDRAVYLRR